MVQSTGLKAVSLLCGGGGGRTVRGEVGVTLLQAGACAGQSLLGKHMEIEGLVSMPVCPLKAFLGPSVLVCS